jgi:integration host factor subunit beta
MTKKDMARSIAEATGIPERQALAIIQGLLDEIIETLVQERRIELRNFGIFEVRVRKPRQARNPKTGEKVVVAERWGVRFQAGLEMEKRVRQLNDERAGTPHR